MKARITRVSQLYGLISLILTSVLAWVEIIVILL